MSSVPISTTYVKHCESTLKKKMESINITKAENKNKEHAVLMQQKPFNNAAFCKATDTNSKAFIEKAKLILFAP